MKKYYGVELQWNQQLGVYQLVCKSCGEINPRRLWFYDLQGIDCIKRIGRCGCCGRYISEKEAIENETEQHGETLD